MVTKVWCWVKREQIVKELNNYIKENDLISIKGYIEIDDLHRIIIVATKITFLSSKKAQN